MKYLLSFIPFILCSVFGISQNLVSNGDFENNGQLDCASWYDGCKQELTYLCDTLIHGNPCDVDFYKDAPDPGGVWSLGCTGIGNSFPATASTYITGQMGMNIYQLNIWMKDPGQAFGGAHIGTRSHGIYKESKTIQTESVDWAYYTVLDTLTINPSDSIQISLSAFAAGPSFGIIYFDQVEFFLLDSLTSGTTNLDLNASGQVSIYPNPARENITIDIHDNKQEHTIYLYSSTGQLIQTLITSDQSIAIDMKDLDSGLYFYRVERAKERRVIGKGKIIVQ